LPENHSIREIWKNIPGFGGWYQASSFGRIRSRYQRYSRRRGPWRVLSPVTNKHAPYPRLELRAKKHYKVHKLIALTFLGQRPKWKVINHKNGIKADNRLENLEYVTHSEDCLHATRLGLRKFGHMKGENNPRHKLTAKIVRAIRSLDGRKTPKEIAEEFKITLHHVQLILRRKIWKDI
jgi:HNH endonuclease/NUMOD4 motif